MGIDDALFLQQLIGEEISKAETIEGARSARSGGARSETGETAEGSGAGAGTGAGAAERNKSSAVGNGATSESDSSSDSQRKVCETRAGREGEHDRAMDIAAASLPGQKKGGDAAEESKSDKRGGGDVGGSRKASVPTGGGGTGDGEGKADSAKAENKDGNDGSSPGSDESSCDVCTSDIEYDLEYGYAGKGMRYVWSSDFTGHDESDDSGGGSWFDHGAVG